MTTIRVIFGSLVAASALVGTSTAVHVPGVHPRYFTEGYPIPVKIKALSSVKTGVPSDTYELPFCRPKNAIQPASESIGEFLTGEKLVTSPFEIKMFEEVSCRKICQVQLTEQDSKTLKQHIRAGYHHNWLIGSESLPSANTATYVGPAYKNWGGAFPVGFISQGETEDLLYNHFRMVLDYVGDPVVGGIIVGFSVEPISIHHHFNWYSGYKWDGVSEEGFRKPMDSCPNGHIFVDSYQRVATNETIIYTIDVEWKKSDKKWPSRWDIYLNPDPTVMNPRVNWTVIVHSIVMAFTLTALVVSGLMGQLKKDVAAYNSSTMAEKGVRSSEHRVARWGLLQGDVFRPPTVLPMLFTACLGTGVQLAVTMFCGLSFAAIGYISPRSRGFYMLLTLIVYGLSYIPSGYVSARFDKTFHPHHHPRLRALCAFITGALFPVMLFGIYAAMVIGQIIFHRKIPPIPITILHIFLITLGWCFLSVPLTYLGASRGYKSPALYFPSAISANTTPRSIPESKTWYFNPAFGMAAAGFIPFFVTAIELFFIMKSVWLHAVYWAFWILLLVYITLLTTCAHISVLWVYYQLCSENHRWWWFSFVCAGGVSFYVMASSVIMFYKLEPSLDTSTYYVYFGYMSCFSAAIFLLSGSVGALSSFWFVHKIFSAIRAY